MSDDDSPTPRLTHLWLIWSEAARETADKLLRIELVLTKQIERYDRDEADRARAMRILSESFVKTFNNWSTSNRPAESKIRQRNEFEAFLRVVNSFLEAHK